MIEAGRFFLPGPTEVRPEILQEMTRRMISHRGAAMQELMRRVTARLGPIFGTTRPVHVITGSGTAALEMATRAGSQKRVLSVVHGDFGERFARIAESCGRTVVRLVAEPGEVVELDRIRDALRKERFDALTVTHSETATGVLADVASVAAIAREQDDCLVLVDGVSSVAATPCKLDEWGLDALVTASQKALAIPPGLAFAAASERLVARARQTGDRGTYLDLVHYEAKTPNGQSPSTPAVPQLFALDRQLADIEKETLDARFARHRAMSDHCLAWIDRVGDTLGVRLLARRDRRSPAVTGLISRAAPSAILKGMRDVGFTLGSGQPPVKDTTFRIGHMGDHTVAGLQAMLAVLEETLRAVA